MGMDSKVDATAEFNAMRSVHDALVPLDEEARTRVLNYISSLFGVTIKSTEKNNPGASNSPENKGEDDGGDEAESAKPLDRQQFSTFAELHDAASPKTNAENALVAGYWLQVCKGAPSFTANPANKELAHLGHRLTHITDDLTALKGMKPSLVLQLKKSGSTKQAKKTYKITQAGINKVLGMISG
jgi:hypothetical protein